MPLNDRQQVLFTVPSRPCAKRKTKIIRKRHGNRNRQVPFAFVVKEEVVQRPAKYTPKQLKELFELF